MVGAAFGIIAGIELGKVFRLEILRRVQTLTGPDRLHIWAYWLADYHPGHPDGEHRIAERGQFFVVYEDEADRRWPDAVSVDTDIGREAA